MHAGTGQNGAGRNVAVHRIQMQFATNPAFLMTLAITFKPHVTTDRQVRQVLGQRSRRLEFQAFGGVPADGLCPAWAARAGAVPAGHQRPVWRRDVRAPQWQWRPG